MWRKTLTWKDQRISGNPKNTRNEIDENREALKKLLYTKPNKSSIPTLTSKKDVANDKSSKTDVSPKQFNDNKRATKYMHIKKGCTKEMQNALTL